MAPQINVQLTQHADIGTGKAALAAVPGVLRVRQVFPEQEDDELRRMFIVDVDASHNDTVLARLQRLGLVEDAELVPQRGLTPLAEGR